MATQIHSDMPHEISFLLHLADNSLIMGHRLSEWTGHGPSLEQDIALTNIALDLIGQARNFYQYAADLISTHGTSVTEDTLAYHRDAHEFKNLLLVELPNGDWGYTILKVFFFSNWQHLVYEELMDREDSRLAGIAEKSLKEVAYHMRWSSEWVLRLGDGTAESHRRMQASLDDLWPYTGESFIPASWESGAYAPSSTLKQEWLEKVSSILEESTLKAPPVDAWMQKGGKEGIHTEHLGYILAEMQFLQRAYPGCEW